MIRHTKDQYTNFKNLFEVIDPDLGPNRERDFSQISLSPFKKGREYETERSEEGDCDPMPCGCDGIPEDQGGGGPCVGQLDSMGNEYICGPICGIIGGADCCWQDPSDEGRGIYDPATGRYWQIVNGVWVYGVYECIAMGPDEGQECDWVYYTVKGHQVVDMDGEWGRRVIQPNFNPWYYYEIDTDNDGVNDMACGFFYDWATGTYHFGCQIIF